MDKFLQNNTVAKIIAILLALMLWLIVRMDDQPYTPVRQQTGELTVDNVIVEAIYDEELYSVADIQDRVQILLTGRRALLNLNQLRADPYRLYVDLTNLEAGTHRVPVQYEGFPSELEVDVIPSHIQVVLEEKELGAFNVQIETTGAPREGFELGNPVVSPDEVHVIAPSSVIDEVALVRGFVNVNGADEEITETVELRVYDQLGNEIDAEVSPASVEVYIPIRSPSKQVPIRVNPTSDLPDGFELNAITTDINTVEVFAPLEDLEELQEIVLPLDLSEITSSGTIEYRIPVDGDWIAVDPGVVNITIEVEPIESRTFNQLPIQVNGLTDDLELEFIDPQSGRYDIRVLGLQDELGALQNADIAISINVEGLGPGNHRVSLTIQVPDGFEVAETNQLRIRITERDEGEEAIGDEIEDGEEEEEDNEEGGS
ncbi:YbbR-like domain-containing protein [Bacillus horti]|uniref:YbbR domain-containing protein n=1 Tax=Caldalkalibacillus horti TaxID=77523 RepID=A0ABT9VYT2_9BACI|nr:CdaR family protein [Bacillus horti]MDQ0166124.1 YbbR domain-containing protein [Bacillus horti]